MNNTQSTTTKSTTIPQLDKANEVLKGLYINVTTSDRKAAEKKYKISRFTTGAYLSGDGKDLDQAMKLIEFFQQRIEEREKKLTG